MIVIYQTMAVSCLSGKYLYTYWYNVSDDQTVVAVSSKFAFNADVHNNVFTVLQFLGERVVADHVWLFPHLKHLMTG